MSPTAPITVEIHNLGLGKREALASDVSIGLSKRPKELPPRWFYDDRGSELFEEITELPEYYQTRTEAAILSKYADDITERTQPSVIVELGAGASTKTRLLIDAARRNGSLQRFLPFDVSDAIVQRTARELVEEFPGLTVHAVIGDFGTHLDRIPRFDRQLVVFLGSTIGNFDPAERAVFLSAVRALLKPGDSFLLGMDLVKDHQELIAAYDDAQGVTAQFNLNVLEVINRELGANFDVSAFQHVALYNTEFDRIEMHLRSLRRQSIAIPGAELVAEFDEGELMRTEISSKFTRERVETELAAAGLVATKWYTDPNSRFALSLSAPD